MSDQKKIVGAGIIIVILISTIIAFILNIDSKKSEVGKTNNNKIILNNPTEDTSNKNIPAAKHDTNKNYIEKKTNTSP